MLRRAAVVCAGLGLGIAVAVLLFPVGLAVLVMGAGDTGADFSARMVDLLGRLSASPDPVATAAAAAHAIWSMVMTLCCLPVVIVALIGEAGRIRGLLWYAGGTAFATAAIPVVLEAGRSGAASVALPGRAEGLVLLGLGACAGAAYGIVAGAARATAASAPEIRGAGPNETWQKSRDSV